MHKVIGLRREWLIKFIIPGYSKLSCKSGEGLVSIDKAIFSGIFWYDAPDRCPQWWKKILFELRACSVAYSSNQNTVDRAGRPLSSSGLVYVFDTFQGTFYHLSAKVSFSPTFQG